MGAEIERKFRLQDDSWRPATAGERYKQGYLSLDPDRTVRVRLAGSSGWLTIKGRTQGISRPEYEYPIPAADAAELLRLCVGPLIEKVRYRVPHGSHVWEVDVFEGQNAGLVVAEVEMATEEEEVELPPWVGAEVTGNPMYSNSALSQRPYCTWEQGR